MRLLGFGLLVSVGMAAQAEVPRVSVDVAPIHGLVARVMQGVGEPDLIIPPGATPHGYAMRPSEARALAEADVVFWVGPALSPWMEEPIETLAEGAEHVTLMELEGIELLAFRTGARFEAHDHDHDAHGHEDAHSKAEQHDDHNHDEDHAHDAKHDDHGHDEDHAHDAEHDDHAHGDDHAHAEKHQDDHGHDHAEGALDGHIWLHPDNAIKFTDKIAAVLAAQDPQNAEAYKANAEAAKTEIGAAAADVRAELAPVADRPFVVFHDSYHYFEQAFGVTTAASITLGDETGASAARLAEVRDIVSETGATCALVEPRSNAGLVEAVAGGSGLQTVTLDALGVDLEPGTGYYTALLRQISAGMTGCLSK